MSTTTSGGRVADTKVEVQHLESRLLTATRQDEALDLAIRAAELCMSALRIATDARDKSELNAHCQQLLKQAETIKGDLKWMPSPHAAPFQPATQRKESSTPLAKASVSLDPNSLAFRPRATADALPAGLEKLGQHTSPSETPPSQAPPAPVPRLDTQTGARVKRLLEPASTRQQSKAEQILVLRASQLNGCRFPPWKAAPGQDQFEPLSGVAIFRDSMDLTLSSEQMDLFAGWMRAKDALPPPTWRAPDSHPSTLCMDWDRPVDLIQDVAADCSIIAGLCAGVSRAERGHFRLLSAIMFPYDTENKRPKLSPNGKYIMRLNFNGCYRQVVIDDRLPVSKTERVLHVLDRNNPTLVWPALLEKAYLKVRGGYSFPGSNPCTDLWVIAGWIPEHVFIQDDRVEPAALWKRILNAHHYGDVLMNLGTGQMSRKVERSLGLAAHHAYAVLDLKEHDGQRLLLVKNPWCQGSSWKGGSAGSTGMRAHDTNTESSLLDVDVPGQSSGVLDRSSSSFPRSEEQYAPGTFWIDLNHVMQNFESIYLNWNPGLFTNRQDIHFSWDLSDHTKRGTQGCFAHNPQFVVCANKRGSLWLLLCRHFKNVSKQSDDLLDLQETMIGDLAGHISLYIYTRDGQRVYISDGAIERGPYVDSPQTLLRVDAEAGKSYTVVPSEQGFSPTAHTFTLSAFASCGLFLEPVASRYSHEQTALSAWKPDSAGGNSHSATYTRNPQFSLAASTPVALKILLETRGAADDVNVHVALVHGAGGKRVARALKQRDVLADSGDYRRQSCVAALEALLPGAYTLVASTFEAGLLARFALRVYSSAPVLLRALPGENAGRLPLRLPLASFPTGVARVACLLWPVKMVRLCVAARLVAAGRGMGMPPPPMRVGVELGRGPNARTLLRSEEGAVCDAVVGVRTGDVDLFPDLRREGEVVVVLERLLVSSSGSGSVEAGIGVEQYGVELWMEGVVSVDAAVTVGRGWMEWD